MENGFMEIDVDGRQVFVVEPVSCWLQHQTPQGTTGAGHMAKNGCINLANRVLDACRPPPYSPILCYDREPVTNTARALAYLFNLELFINPSVYGSSSKETFGEYLTRNLGAACYEAWNQYGVLIVVGAPDQEDLITW
jgi:hypothetical protein